MAKPPTWADLDRRRVLVCGLAVVLSVTVLVGGGVALMVWARWPWAVAVTVAAVAAIVALSLILLIYMPVEDRWQARLAPEEPRRRRPRRVVR